MDLSTFQGFIPSNKITYDCEVFRHRVLLPKSAKITLLLLQPPIENTGQMMDEYFLPFHPNSIEKLSSNYLSKMKIFKPGQMLF
jgi:uncharacterized lipoprotein YbaY